MGVVEAGEVFPDDFLAVMFAGGVGDAAVVVADEPFGVFAGEGGIVGAVVDDEVGHGAQAEAARPFEDRAELVVGRGRVGGVSSGGVEVEVIGDGVEAAGGSELLEGVNEDPVEAHPGGAGEVGFPLGERADEGGEEVVEEHRGSESVSQWVGGAVGQWGSGAGVDRRGQARKS